MKSIDQPPAVVNSVSVPEQDADAVGELLDTLENEPVSALRARLHVVSGALADLLPADVSAPSSFRFMPGGIWLVPRAAGGGEPEQVRVSDLFLPLGEAADEAGSSGAVVVEWTSRYGGRQERAVISQALMRAIGTDLAAMLASRGLHIEIGREADFKRLLAGVRSARLLRLATAPGWHEVDGAPAYVLPTGQGFGPAAAAIVLDGLGAEAARLGAVAGTPEGWREHVAAPAAGNSRLVVALSMAFAGPLLEIANEPSGGLVLVGASQSGKSTALLVAGSVAGRGERGWQVGSFRATANGLEAIAAAANDGLLLLDELGEVSPTEAADIGYVLGNGQGKARADRSGGARTRRTWRTLTLASAEIGIAEHAAKSGRRPETGVAVRLPSIPADAGAGLGIFDHLHTFPSPAALANALRDAARTHYGTAFPAFLERLTAERAADPDGLARRVASERATFLAAALPGGADPQVQTIAARFGLIAAAGELATGYGLTGWSTGEATSAARTCFDAWLAARGNSGSGEATEAVETLRLFLTQHGSSRFETIYSDGSPAADGYRVANRAGFRKILGESSSEFWILPAAWQEIFKGQDPRRAAKALLASGLLRGSEGRSTTRVSLPGIGQARVWVVPAAILAGAP